MLTYQNAEGVHVQRKVGNPWIRAFACSLGFKNQLKTFFVYLPLDLFSGFPHIFKNHFAYFFNTFSILN